MKGHRHSPVSNEGGDISVNGRYLNIYCVLAVSQDCWWKCVWGKEQCTEEATALICTMRAGTRTGYKPGGSHQASRNVQRIPAAEAMDSFQISSWEMWNYIYPRLFARFLYSFQDICVLVELLVWMFCCLRATCGYTGHFFCQSHPGTLWPFKWTVQVDSFS